MPGAQLGATLRAQVLLGSEIHVQASVYAHEVLVRGSIVVAGVEAEVDASGSNSEMLGIALGRVTSVPMAIAIATVARVEVGILAVA